MPRIVITEVILPEALTRVRDLVGKPDPMLTAIGAYVKATAQEAFTEQGRPKGTWQQRGVPNVAGILRDFHEGRTEPGPDRFKPRPALIDRGDLKGSIDFDVVGNGVEVGSNRTYAASHQFGEDGVETEEITEEFQAWLAKFMTKQVGAIKRGFGDEAADMARASLDKGLGFLLSPFMTGDRLEIDIPARPFLDVLPEDEANIDEIALDFLTGKVAEGG